MQFPKSVILTDGSPHSDNGSIKTESPKDAHRRESLKELSKNLEGEIRNPLKGIPKAQLLENVARWRVEKGLDEDILPLLTKGALVAQNPVMFEDIEELDDEEKDHLRREVTHRWKQPWPLYYTIILNSIAAAIQGWDQVRNLLSLHLLHDLQNKDAGGGRHAQHLAYTSLR
jgi:hypothetical protein